MELLSLLPVIGFTLGWIRWQESSSSAALLHAVSGMLAILFVGSLVGALLPASLLLVVAGTVLAAVESVRLVLRKKSLPVPLGMFALLCIAFWLMHSGASYFFYDEYSHWGVFLKEMLGSNQLWGADSNSMHPRYLPGASLWQYFFALFSRNMEGAAYLAQFSLLMAPLMVLWEKTEWRRPGWIAGVFALVVIAISNFGHGFTSLYVDHLLGAWFAGVLLNFIFEFRSRSVWQLSSFLIPISTIILFKSTGAFFAIALAGTLALLIVLHPQFKLAGSSYLARLKYLAIFPVAIVGVIAFVLLAWNMNRNSISLPETGGSTSRVATQLVSQQSIYDEDQQAELTRRFVEVISHQQISKC